MIMHGGRLKEAKQLFPMAPQSWVDLSTGINPYSYPFDINKISLKSLPDPNDEEALRCVAAKAYGASSEQFVAAVPGTQIAISLMPHILDIKNVYVLWPTYMEHLNSWEQLSIPVHKVSTFEALSSCARGEKTMGVLCNPNNPDGQRFPIEKIKYLADQFAESGNILLVDEAFMDLEGSGAACLLPHPALILLRSFGKTYGLGGLRLGFVIANAKKIMEIRQMLGPWSINNMAIAIAYQALQDQKWLKQIRFQLSQECQKMAFLFQNNDWKLIGGTHLFSLIEHIQAQHIWESLGKAGILARRFDYNPHWLRFGLPFGQESWNRFEDCIAQINDY